MILTAAIWVTSVTMPIQEPFAGRLSPMPKGYVCCRAKSSPKLDGTLNDPAWNDAPWTDDFVDIEGDIKPKPRFRTRAKLLWDDQFLYIGAEMEEPQVWATLAEHDSVIFQDNDFEVFVDPDGDCHLYGEIEVNAFGTEWDLLLPKPYKDDGSAIDSWEIPGLIVKTHVDGKINDPSSKDIGWSVEIAIPWDVLSELTKQNCPPKNGDQWRINFSRVEWKTAIEDGRYVKVRNTSEDNWVWSPQGVIDMHRPERWGYLQFSEKEPGADRFLPDADLNSRELLSRIYYAQREFMKKHDRFSTSLTELMGDRVSQSFASRDLRLQTTDSGFECSLATTDKKSRLHIREDSRIWRG